MNRLKKRILALGLAVVLTLTMIPMLGSLAFAEEAGSITVYLTVSNQGALAKANDGTAMGLRPVTVTDLNSDGKYSFDEALVAAHKAYNSEAGYAKEDSQYGAYVTKLWGVSNGAYLFFTDNSPLSVGVEGDYVEDGDALTAAILVDGIYYSDYYTFFDDYTLQLAIGEEATVELQGYMGSAFGEIVPEPIADAAIGYYTSDGTYVGLETETGEDGKATISFAAPGTYFLTATGTIPGVEVTDWATGEKKTIDAATIAPCCVVYVETSLETVLAAIDTLSNDPRDYTTEDTERVLAIEMAYDELSEEDQKTVDSTFGHPSGDTQSYGRILEAAVWAVSSYYTDTATTLPDATYTTTTDPAVSSESSKGKSDSSRVRNWWVESVEVKDGKATAYVYVTSGAATKDKLTSYPSVWVGGQTINRDENNNYAIPVDVNGTTYFGGISSSMPRPIMYALSTTITEPTVIPAENITNNTGMFKVVSASYAMNEDESATLTFALSGTGYHYLFKGTYEEAVKNGAATENWIEGYQNAAGKWEFKMAVSKDEIGKDVPVVAISQSYYEKYLKGENPIARAFYPRQLNLDTDEVTLVTGDYDHYDEVKVTNNVSMFSVASAQLHTVGGPNSNGYTKDLIVTMGSNSFGKVALSKARKADDEEQYEIVDKVVVLPVEWNEKGGETYTSVLADGERVTTSWWSIKNSAWYERDMTLDTEGLTLVFDNTVKSSTIIDPYYDSTKTLDEMKADLEAAIDSGALVVTPELVDDMIAVIYVQYREEKTDFYCMATKVLWDSLSEEQQEFVEEYDYYGLDTGDASLDDPLNQDEIGEKELLVVSFGTSFNKSRVEDIKAIEDKLQEEYPDWSVRRAFTAQIIINHIQSREGEAIDNMDQALQRAIDNGVKELLVQPTHLMHGAEYDEMCEYLAAYSDDFDKILIGEPLLDSYNDKGMVAFATVAAAIQDSKYDSLEEMEADGTAIVFMGHGTAHPANVTYTEMQQMYNDLGCKNVFVGTVEGEPEGTDVETVLAAVQTAGYTKVILRPLMVVAGDHANNDMAGDEEDSWKTIFSEALGAENVSCQIKGLGELGIVQDIYDAHVENAISLEHFTGFRVVNGILGYYIDGMLADSVTGLVKDIWETGNWYYVQEGIVDRTESTVVKNEYGWWAVVDGQVDFNFKGFLPNEYGWWYLENGTVSFAVNDILQGEANTDPELPGVAGWWLVRGSQVVDETTVAKNANGWWYVNHGMVDFGYTGVARNENGWWAIYKGQVNFGYNGFADNENGWWYCENGQVTFNKNDILKGTANNAAGKEGVEGWWLVRGSKVVDQTTVAKNANGWWYVNQGMVDFGYTGVARNENGWWAIQNGAVNFGYNGFLDNANGWWWLENGTVTFKKNDILKGEANNAAGKPGVLGWWLIEGSAVSNKTTVAKNANGWWYVEDGMVDFDYNGAGENDYGIWYIKDGKVDFTFTGDAYGYHFVNGRAQFE